MDRYGLFVDAGYLLMAGGEVCAGARSRTHVSCDYGGAHAALVAAAEQHSGLTALRTYWYDGGLGLEGQPTTDHYKIAAIPNLKLRLGRVVRKQQKGVDSLLTRDLMTLARERALVTAYLVTGDEDMREGVLAAQDMGVRVVLVGFPAGKQSRQSLRLINECDEHLVLEPDAWKPLFALVAPSNDAASTPPSILTPLPGVAAAETEEAAASAIGRAFANDWVSQEGSGNAQLIASGFPNVPRDVDALLMRQAEATLGSLREREGLRREVRTAFVDELRQLLDP